MAALQASLSITNYGALLKLMSIELVMRSNHLILCCPLLLLLQSYPAWGSFQMSQFFTSGGQSIGASASASILPTNIQDWFPLELPGLISLQSKGLSRVFCNATVQKHQFFSIQPSSQSNSHITMLQILGPTHSFTIEKLCSLMPMSLHLIYHDMIQRSHLPGLCWLGNPLSILPPFHTGSISPSRHCISPNPTAMWSRMYFSFFFSFVFWLHHMASGILVLWPGIETQP